MHFFLFLLLMTFVGNANGMTNFVIKDAGEFSSAFTFEVYDTSHFWNEHGQTRKAYANFHRHEYLSYSEHGVTAKDTVGLQASFDRIEEDLNGNTYGLGDFEITWKHLAYSLCQHHIATQVTALIPVKTEFTPALSYGRYGAEFALFYYSDFNVYRCIGWYDLKAGYRYYQGFPSDQIRSHIRVGFALGSYLQLLAGTFLEYGLFNGHSQMCENIFSLHPNYRLWKAEFQAAFCLSNRYYLSLGYVQHLWGENVGSGGGPFASAAISF